MSQKQLVAKFGTPIETINYAVNQYRREGGELHITSEAANGHSYVGGDAQAVMEVIGIVSRCGHGDLIQVLSASD